MDRRRIVGEWVEPITRTFKSLLANPTVLTLIRTNGGGPPGFPTSLRISQPISRVLYGGVLSHPT